jgi:leucyl aminopeptidase
MIHIGLKKEINQVANIVVLAGKNANFSIIVNGSAELDYVQKAIAEKARIIPLNFYNRWVWVIPVEEDENRYRWQEKIRRSGASLQPLLHSAKITSLEVLGLDISSSGLLALAEGLMLSSYRFAKYQKESTEKKFFLESIHLVSHEEIARPIEELVYQVDAVYRTRDLINEPLSYLTAVQLAKEIQIMGKEAGFETEVYNKQKIEDLKMGGLLAVNRGSIDPPTFTIMEWKPRDARNKKPVVLVGKGIVFDTGGLSLKPTADSMDYMKCDMSGAAIVAGTLYAIAKAKLPVHVIGLVPATDNRPDGNAYVPGDVVRMHDGTTVEVLNTDAEGRMILADALSYAKKYDPELVINLATLTGSAQMAIGQYGIVTMGNASAAIWDKLKQAGDAVHERVAEFPFWEEYEELIKSDIADLKNVGPREAGSITAGKFLSHFTSYPFIHMDIAGNAFLKKEFHYISKGGTGTGTRLLFQFLKNY